MRRKALLVCERDTHTDHSSRLLRVAEWLMSRGWDALVALPDPSCAGRSSGLQGHVLQAPQWPAERAAPRWSSQTPMTLGGFLVEAGAAHPLVLRGTVSAARGLVDLVQPDLVIADNAPATQLACLSGCPALIMGDGFPLPADPCGDTEPTDRLAHWIQSELSLDSGIRKLSQLFSGDGSLCFQLRHDQSIRREGPSLSCRPPGSDIVPSASKGDVLLLDLTTGAIQSDALFAAILRHRGSRRLWSPGLPAQVATALQNADVELLAAPPASDAYAHVGAVVHAHGPDHIASLAAAGLPQLVVLAGRQHDPAVVSFARQIENRGAGAILMTSQIAVPDIADMFLRLPEKADAARAFAEEIARDPLPEWTDALERLLAELNLQRD